MKREVVEYFIPRDNFWKWADGGKAVEWPDGSTIAFREELLAVLERLAPPGLPPLTAVLLLLAATRTSWVAASRQLTAEEDDVRQRLRAAVVRLNRLVELHDQLATLEARCVLAEIVFDHAAARTWSPTLSGEVVERLRDGLWPELLEPLLDRSRTVHGSTDLLRAAELVAAGLDRVNQESLELRIRTGLERLPHGVDPDLTPAARTRDLLSQLSDDPEHAGLVRLARDLMAAVTLPRPVSAPDDLPLGGFSDISNRGSLDRLLLSELANDELTLSVRVAMNEALFLRRESPPKAPARQRTLLLDSGIRTWGIPRLYTTSIALALSAVNDPHSTIACFRGEGDTLAPLDLMTREGLVEHLSVLRPEAHLGEALPTLQSTLEASELESETLIITTEDAANDREFQLAMSQQGPEAFYLITVNRDGRMRIWERGRRGAKLLREAVLNVSDLFAEPETVIPTIVDRTWANDLPAILSVEPFPLMLSHNVDPKRTWAVRGRGALTVDKDRRLMHWRYKQGGIQIADDLPSSRLWWGEGEPQDDVVSAVIGSESATGLNLLRINLEERLCEAIELKTGRQPMAVVSHGVAIFVIVGNRVQTFERSTGELMDEWDWPPNDIWWRRGRFFQARSGDWSALSYGRRGARIEPLPSLPPKVNLVTLFDKAGVDGPIGLTNRGDLWDSVSGEIRKTDYNFGSAVQLEGLSDDGQLLALSDASMSYGGVLVDTDSLAVSRYTGDVAWKLLASARRSIKMRTQRRSLIAIGVDSDGELLLESKKGIVTILYDESKQAIVGKARPVRRRSVMRKRRTFKLVSLPRRIGYRLSVASWSRGGQAFLDNRGLLHLRSSNPSVPESTLVLDDSGIAGWCDRGRRWGRPYFVGPGGVDTREVFVRVIKAFTAELTDHKP